MAGFGSIYTKNNGSFDGPTRMSRVAKFFLIGALLVMF